ncbi:hypothetical protein SAMN02745947_03182 [Rhodococcus rhodochrous J3]|uniref:Nitroreductase domain-containing protein n=2 Tax=Rhodococcus rhodochrous TaxID=1829 RepID=A0ABY1MCV0_RHORH|nr:hypothetical protein L612_001000001020 [Rhodococcus rhodochrous J38]SMG45357.1 hypothetical protein SAMN02745947_03182 [Rhodococcus rhodochrous J3]
METMPDRRTLESAVASAGRTPSLHNSQPWRWVLDADGLTLFSDNDRILPATDPSGRQMLLSCGAVLHHLRTALIARHWATEVERMPDPTNRRCLATLRFHRTDAVSDIDLRMAEAIGHRRTERLPMEAPPQWEQTESALQTLVESTGVHLSAIAEHERPALEELSRRIGGERRSDAAYQTELSWWAGHGMYPDGIPPDALPPGQRTVATEREFPPGSATGDSAEAEDRAAILLLSTTTDTRLDWLRSGEALSAVLLACTARGLATCSVTHLTESESARVFLRDTARIEGAPQAMIRVGVRSGPVPDAATPRRPISEILFRTHP